MGEPSTRPGLRRLAACGAAIIGLIWHWNVGIRHFTEADFEPSPRVVVPPRATLAAASAALGPDTGSSADPRHYRERFAPSSGTDQVHATSAYAHATGGLTAFWYGGTREGARDVALYSARLKPEGEWQPVRRILDRTDVIRSQGRAIRKIGNATVHKHADGRIWMIFVTVAVGGWAGSSINLSESLDNGGTWSPPRRLVTSPFFNLSTLVRGDAIRYVDGSVGLPVYHEFIGKFAELIRISPDGRILRKTRLSTGREALQPEIVATGPREAFGVLRYAGPPPRQLLQVSTTDGGRSWSAPNRMALANPNAAFDLVHVGDGDLLAVVNDTENHRDRLTLTHSDDGGRSWRTLKHFDLDENAEDGLDEYSYPWLLRTADGRFHVFYTWNRTRIKHVEFSPTWLAERRRALPSQARR